MRRSIIRKQAGEAGEVRGGVHLHHKLTPDLMCLFQGHPVSYVLNKVEVSKQGPRETGVISVVTARGEKLDLAGRILWQS